MVIKTYPLIDKYKAIDMMFDRFEDIPKPDIGQNYMYWKDCGLWTAFYDAENQRYTNDGVLEIFGVKPKLINIRRN